MKSRISSHILGNRPNILVSRPRPVWVTWRFASRDHLIPQVPFL